MRVVVFSTHAFERPFLEEANARHGHELTLLDARLGPDTVALAQGFPALAAFASDRLDAPILERLHAGGTRLIALRSAGFNHVDLVAAERLGLAVARVPAYSPYAIAEHTAGLILALNRKLHRAIARVREHNFTLDGLLGFDLHGKTVGIVGTGRIGSAFARIMHGFGCALLAHDPVEDPALVALGTRYVALPDLLRGADVVSLHCPLTPATRHLIDAAALALLKPNAMLVNTSRGAVIDTRALLAALKARRIGSVALDVYEEEADLFFHDLSGEVLEDDVLARLLTFPNVIVTAHQAFFTQEALRGIEATTLENVSAFEQGGRDALDPANVVDARLLAPPDRPH